MRENGRIITADPSLSVMLTKGETRRHGNDYSKGIDIKETKTRNVSGIDERKPAGIQRKRGGSEEEETWNARKKTFHFFSSRDDPGTEE